MADSLSIASMTESLENFQDNGLMIETNPSTFEKVYDYEPGGHHPVHLGDIIHQCYRVIHKLGSGGYANVWLCYDTLSSTPRYVAVKIIMAEGSTKDCPELRVNKLIELGHERESLAEHLCLPLDQFEIDGPNGSHFALVYPVLGPRVSKLLNIAESENLGDTLRKICCQVTQAMAALHAHGICHGDFRPANILSRLSGLDGSPEDEVLDALGRPITTKVVTISGDSHNKDTAPQYLVYPIRWDDVASDAITKNFITNKACVIDFGESFDISEPPPDLGIPQFYCSPEYSLEKHVGIGCDIWALGCTLFEIRTGRRLFDSFDDDLDEYLCMVAKTLGKFPEPWWSETWEARKALLEDEADANGLVVEVRRGSELPDSDLDRDQSKDRPRAAVIQPPEPRSLHDLLTPGLYYEGRSGPEGFQRAILQEEIDLFSDLLARLLKYTPQERASAKEILEHEWFKM